jgi:hypothetical protein
MSNYIHFGGGDMRPCWVRPDRERWPEYADQEWPGLVGAWRRKADRWEAWVQFRTGMGETRGGWFDAGQVRERD